MAGDPIGELAALPGAERLRALVEALRTVDTAAVTGTGRRFGAVADGVAGSTGALGRGAGGVGEAWKGPGADAFARYAEQVGRAGDAVGSAARSAESELGRVGAVLRDAVTEVTSQVSAALDAAARARARAASVPSGVGVAEAPDAAGAEAMVRAAVAEPSRRAEAAVARAEGELAEAAGRLRALVAPMAGFSRLPVPGAGVVPGGGAGSGWTPRACSEGAGGAADPGGGPDGSGDDLIESPGAGIVPAEPGADPGSGAAGGPAGQVGDWIREATAILAAEGVPAEKMDPDDIATIIERESGGDPGAVNGWDSNAAQGTPSQGLMQTIGPTFEAYKLPGHEDIRDPVDNIIAGVRYAIARYGSVSQVPGVEALSEGRAYVGY